MISLLFSGEFRRHSSVASYPTRPQLEPPEYRPPSVVGYSDEPPAYPLSQVHDPVSQVPTLLHESSLPPLSLVSVLSSVHLKASV